MSSNNDKFLDAGGLTYVWSKIKGYIQNKLQLLANNDTATAGKFVTSVSEANGVVTVSKGGMDNIPSFAGNIPDTAPVLIGSTEVNDNLIYKAPVSSVVRKVHEEIMISNAYVLYIDKDNYDEYLTPITNNEFTFYVLTLDKPYTTVVLDFEGDPAAPTYQWSQAGIPIKFIRSVAWGGGNSLFYNGYRLTIVGDWVPVELDPSDYVDPELGQSSLDDVPRNVWEGKFSRYVYDYRAGVPGPNLSHRLFECYEDYIYFNGVWYSKGY